jgi:hypothetical protein
MLRFRNDFSPAMPSTAPSPPDALTRLLRWAVVLGFALAAADYTLHSLHWPLMLDSPVMHYIVLLLHHGLRPYADIGDNNLPGAYLTEAWAMRLFGPTDLAWRLYEFFLLALLTTALVLTTRPTDSASDSKDGLAGILAAALFLALHASEGPRQAVEREEVIAVLVLVGYAALFAAVRRRQPWLLLVFGLTGGLALSIKPTFLPLYAALLILLLVTLWRDKTRPHLTVPQLLPYLACALVGFAVITAIMLRFLLHDGVLQQFLDLERLVTPVYRGPITRPWFLAARTIPKYMLPLLPLGLLCALANYRAGLRWNWERLALALGVVFGVFSYFAQGKGLAYHRYVYLVCLLPLISLEAFTALRGSGMRRALGAITVAVALLFTVPVYMLHMHRIASNSDFTLALEADLSHLNAITPLDRQVQCFDMTTGCLNALYHLNLTGNNGDTGDMLYFTKQPNPATDHFRTLYWQRTLAHPPAVIVVSNQYFGEPDGFGKLHFWPQFDQYLRDHYTLALSRTFPMEGVLTPADPLPPNLTPAYRLYLRNDSPTLTAATALHP